MNDELPVFAGIDALASLDPTETLLAPRKGRPIPVRVSKPLVLGPRLGRGGTAEVLLATQRALHREVAVKRPHAREPTADIALRQEAWALGQLEHPNIVPVHDLVVEEGRPLLVMKRIEGVPWEQTLADDGKLPADATADPFAWHLGVLQTVCNAVAFAHDRGFLHRDLKPQNVLIGRYGEVVVVDWGLALSLEPDPTGRLADRGQEATHIVGTPAYMAPEMFYADHELLGPATDVYLLGGLLYRLLAGVPPRRERTLSACARAAKVRPALDEAWPADLRALLYDALSPFPNERPTVEDFRVALGHHLRRRDAVALLDEVEARVASLEDPAQERSDRAYQDDVGAARFGLERAMVGLPDDARARGIHRRLYRHLVHAELEAGRPEAAEVFLRELDPGDPELEAVVEAALERRRMDQRRLEQLDRDLGRTQGRTGRIAAVVLLAIVWLALPTVLGLAGVPRGYGRMLFQNAVVLGVFVGLVVTLGRPLLSSRINRGMLALIACSPLFGMALTITLWLADAPPAALTASRALIDAMLIVLGGLLLDWRAVPSGILYGIAAVCTAAWPAHATPILMSATALWVALLVAIWTSGGILDRRRGRSEALPD
jgi:serine/threonine-protein kinase